MNFKYPFPVIACAAVAYADAPASLNGRTVVANYTNSQYQTEICGEGCTSWVPFSKLKRNPAAAEAFCCGGGVEPKASRNLLPITRPGQGGVYTYRKTGTNTGVIEVDMWKSKGADMGRSYTITFDSPTTGTAMEEVAHGDYIGRVRFITITIK